MQKIPCTFMRSGTSRGPYIDLRDLPKDTAERDKVLLKIMGSPDKKQIDGLGGATFVTSKVVLLQPSEREGIDVDYLFAQVVIDQPIVDTTPTCGNMMAGVGPYAIEQGWVKATHPQTSVHVYNFNTDSTIEVIAQTPNGEVNYTDGDLQIHGVPGVGSPIIMNFSNIEGGATGKLFPTGNIRDNIDGVDITVIDIGNLMMLVKATDLGLTGYEVAPFFANNKDFMQRIETTRRKAGLLAGLGDVSDKVLPKIGILAPPREGGTIASRYLTPKTLHPSHAVTGAICIAAASKCKGTVAADIAEATDAAAERILIEHPCGFIPVEIEVDTASAEFKVVKAGTLRTARKIMDGFVYY